MPLCRNRRCLCRWSAREKPFSTYLQPVTGQNSSDGISWPSSPPDSRCLFEARCRLTSRYVAPLKGQSLCGQAYGREIFSMWRLAGEESRQHLCYGLCGQAGSSKLLKQVIYLRESAWGEKCDITMGTVTELLSVQD